MPFFITICYTILIFARPQDWLPFLSNIHPVDVAAIGAIWVVFSHLLLEGHSKTKKQFWNSPQVWLVLALWAWVIAVYISQLFAKEIIETWEFLGKKTLIFCLIVLTVNTRKRLETIIWVLLGCYLLLGFHGLLQRFTGEGLGGLRPSSHFDGVPRIKGFGIFAGSNEMGGLASFAIVLGLGLARAYGLNLAKSIPAALLSAGMSFILLWTQSRQAILNIAVGLSGLLLPKRLRYAVITLSITLLLFLTAISFHGRWKGDLGNDDSVSGRVAIITKGLQLFKANPILGVGLGRSTDAIDAGIPPHNSFLMVLIDNGYIGFSIWTGIFIVSFFQMRTLMLATPENEEDAQLKRLVSPMMGLLFALMCSSYFTNRPYHADLFFYWGLFTALGNISVRECELEDRPLFFKATALWGRLGMIVLLGGVIGVTGLHLTSRLFRSIF